LFDPSNGDIYVASAYSGEVSVISGGSNTVVATVSIPGGSEPWDDLIYDSQNDDIYVADSGNSDLNISGGVSVISGFSNTLIDTIPAPYYTDGVAYDSGNGDLYVSSLGPSVTVISTSTNLVVANVSLGPYAALGLAYDPQNGYVYAAEPSWDTAVIDGATNTVVGLIPVGLEPEGVICAGGAYVLNTTAVQGYVDANATGIQGQDLYQALPDGFSIQMNAVLTNVTLFGRSGYQFWTQDIVTYFPATSYMVLVTNVWNFSSPLATMTSNSIALHGPYGTDDYSTLGYYYASYTVPYPVSYPFNVTLTLDSSVYNQTDDEVSFGASVFSPTGNFPSLSMDSYDYVVFSSGPGGMLTQPSNFTVDGTGYNRVGLMDDFEIVVCGPGGGSQVDLSTADAALGLAYWTSPGEGGWASVPSAYNYGADTGETSTGANVAWSYSPAGRGPNGLTTYATMTTGPSILSGLWGTGAPPGSYPLELQIAPANAFVFFDYHGAGSGAPFVSELVYAPTMETTTFYLMNGTYTLRVELADYQGMDSPPIPVVGYPRSLSFTLSPDPGLGVYTPLWAFSNSEVQALAQSGGGTPQNPYVLFNNQYYPLPSDFGLYNDFGFPVFPGVFLRGTTVSVELNNSSSFETDTNDFQSSPGLALPPTNDLQFWFWNVTGVALLNDTNISGWFALQTYFPLTFNSFNVIFYASQGNLIANDTFLTQSQGLLMYASGTFYGPSSSVGGGNTVWGNAFVQVTPPVGCAGSKSCLPLLPYSSGLGFEIGEGGDLIYDNLVATPTTAWVLPLNLYTEFPTTWTGNVWNIAPQLVSYYQFAPGFPNFKLTGSIVGGTVQGGNSWWDYGVTQNWANGADNPTGVLPYDENARSLISPSPGYGSPLPGYPCPEYYCATYIYPGGDYGPLTTVATAVSISPQGLPANMPWGVVISCGPAKSGGAGPAKSGGAGPAKSGGAGPCTGGNTTGGDPPPLVLADLETTASVVHLVLPDGAYNWTPLSSTGYENSAGGSFTVNAAEPVTLDVPYAAPSSAVFTFSEEGLSSGVPWQVTVGGTPESLVADGGTDALTFTEPSGTYDYAIAPIPGWGESTLPYVGTITGGAVTEPTLVYTQSVYEVVLSEGGLPSGTSWKVAVAGVAEGLTADGLTDALIWTNLPNGTYPYSVTDNSGWHESTLPYAGTLTVNGGTNPIGGTGIGYSDTLVYSPVTYSVTIAESGLPSGVTWQVTVGGFAKSLVTDGSTDTLTWAGLANGTYAYSISGNPGWHEATLPYGGTLVVNGGMGSIGGSATGYSAALVYAQVSYSAVISEAGLPSGLTWQVTVGGTVRSLTTDGGTDALTWAGLPNGTYSYSVSGNPGWHESALPYAGTLVVSGGSSVVTGSGTGFSVALVYVAVTYTVTISVSGLPSGLSWQATVQGTLKSLTTDGGTDSLVWTGLANGTYAYSVTGTPGWHESNLPYVGALTVNGGTNSIGGSGVGFSSTLAYTRVTYTVSLSEVGLPSGLSWQVTVGGVVKSLTTDGSTDTLSWTGLPNGTYTYSVTGTPGWHEAVLPYSGTLLVVGGTNSIGGSGLGYSATLAYVRVTYSVTFSESGLPSGLGWQATVGGVVKSLTTDGGTDSLSWTGLPNGTYAYSVTGNPGWHQGTLPYAGNLVVNGASVKEPTLTYSRASYSVTFFEVGLSSGLTWKVTVNGVVKSLKTNGSLDWLTWTGLANGTYSYSIADNPGWHELPLAYNGKVVVNGASVLEILVYYRVAYSVTFSESGLPAGLTWTVSVGGVAKSLKTDGKTDSLTWAGLVNGTYAYTISSVSGWHQSTLPSTGNAVVNGASVSESTLKYSH
jgi:thermopsin